MFSNLQKAKDSLHISQIVEIRNKTLSLERATVLAMSPNVETSYTLIGVYPPSVDGPKNPSESKVTR